MYPISKIIFRTPFHGGKVNVITLSLIFLISIEPPLSETSLLTRFLYPNYYTYCRKTKHAHRKLLVRSMHACKHEYLVLIKSAGQSHILYCSTYSIHSFLLPTVAYFGGCTSFFCYIFVIIKLIHPGALPACRELLMNQCSFGDLNPNSCHIQKGLL